MFKGVIFDLDGVLVSTDEFHFRSWQRICAENGFTFFDYEFNHKFRGIARLKCVEILLQAAGLHPTPDEIQEIADRKNRYFNILLESVTPKHLLPGALEMLRELKRRGVGIAIASNSRNAKNIIMRVGISPYLNAIVDGDDITNCKPDPEVFLRAAQELGLEPCDCLVVEDAVAGIIAAEAAGMRVLGIGDRNMLPNARALVRDLSEISIDELLSL
jgi:beta-phosphoglucomutase